MANSVDSDQTPHSAVSDLGLDCLQRPICPNRVIMVLFVYCTYIALAKKSMYCYKQYPNKHTTVLSTSLGKTYFAWRFLLNENILF